MSIQITLTPEQERRLAELARARGKDPSAHVQDMIAAYLKDAGRGETRTFEEILAPIWEGWRLGGLAEDEVDDLLEQELSEVRGERRPSRVTT